MSQRLTAGSSWTRELRQHRGSSERLALPLCGARRTRNTQRPAVGSWGDVVRGTSVETQPGRALLSRSECPEGRPSGSLPHRPSASCCSPGLPLQVRSHPRVGGEGGPWGDTHPGCALAGAGPPSPWCCSGCTDVSCRFSSLCVLSRGPDFPAKLSSDCTLAPKEGKQCLHRGGRVWTGFLRGVSSGRGTEGHVTRQCLCSVLVSRTEAPSVFQVL